VGAHPLGGYFLPYGGGGRVFRMTFILNEMWTRNKINILFGTLLG
jgi:hypothetical protein